MTMSWLMTVQETGTPTHRPPGVEFDLTPRWISLDPSVDDEPPPNPNRFGTLYRWPSVVEIRRPDGIQVSAELRPRSAHINFTYELRNERDAAGRIRSPWRQQILLREIRAEEVPPGSEIWGEITDENFQALKDLSTDTLG